MGVVGALPSPAPRALLLSYGDSAIQYGLRFWIASALDKISSNSAEQQAIWQALRDHSIEIRFTHQVQLKRGMEPLPEPANGPGTQGEQATKPPPKRPSLASRTVTCTDLLRLPWTPFLTQLPGPTWRRR
ncbi:MAG: hypothetical protein RLZZ609_706 [Cyanobacteriota bacterium]